MNARRSTARRKTLWRGLFRMDAGAPLTIQAQLRAQLVAAIGAGRIAADGPLPSSRELASQLRVARNTVVIVYQRLADDGYLVARDRRGYYVNPALLDQLAANPKSPPDVAAIDWSARLRRRPSEQRNISKVANWRDYRYPFIYGQFDPALFPIAEWRACCQQALSATDALDWAEDLVNRDDLRLLEQIRDKVLPARGVWADIDEIVLTIGAQQALYLLADLLFDSQTEVGIENPGYPDARNIFSLRTARLRPLALDEQGLRADDGLRGCRFVYATPSHQSPTMVTMSVDRRRELLRRAESDDFIVIEDDYENETSFSGLPTPALKSLDGSGRVVYIGSLSKTLAPGLRLGYVVAPRPLVEELRALRRLMVRHPTAFIQRSFAQFLALGHYDLLSRRLVAVHRERATALTEALAREVPELQHRPATGGSALWIEGPSWLDARRLADDARAAARVLIEPGDVFFCQHDPPRHFFRLGYASIATERIHEGIRQLGRSMERQRPRR